MTQITITGHINDGRIYGISEVDYSTARSTGTEINSNNASHAVGQRLLTGEYSCRRMFLVFDTSGIPDDAEITKANLKLTTQANNSGTDFDLLVKQCDWSAYNPIIEDDKAALYDLALASDTDVTFVNTSTLGAPPETLTSPDLDTTWIDPQGNTYYALVSSRDANGTTPTGNEFITLYSADESTAEYKPQLVIEYVRETEKYPQSAESSGIPEWRFPTRVSAHDGDLSYCGSVLDPFESKGYTGELYAHNFEFEDYDEIYGVTVTIVRKTGSTGVYDYTLYFTDGNGDEIGDNFADTETQWDHEGLTAKTYGSSTELWSLTSAQWKALLATEGFGVKLVAYNDSISTRVAQVDAISITVYHPQPTVVVPLHWMIGYGRAGVQFESTEDELNTFVGIVEDTLAANPDINLVAFAMYWRNIEPEEGVYSWDKLDAVIDAIIAAGFRFKFSLIPGLRSPDWLFEKDGIELFHAYEAREGKPYYGEYYDIPLPWDTIFQTAWLATVAAVGAHFTSKGYQQYLECVSFAPWGNTTHEIYLPMSSLDMAQWELLDPQTNLPPAFQAAWPVFEAAFPSARLAVESPFNLLGDPDLTIDLLDWAAENHSSILDLQHNAFHGQSDTQDLNRNVAMRDYKSTYPLMRIGAQSKGLMYLPVDVYYAPSGTMTQMAQNIINCELEYFEIWYGNGRNPDVCGALVDLLAGNDNLANDLQMRHPHGTMMAPVRIGQQLHVFRRYRLEPVTEELG